MIEYFTYECECCGKQFHSKNYPESIDGKVTAILKCNQHEEECKKLHDTDWHKWFASMTICSDCQK